MEKCKKIDPALKSQIGSIQSNAELNHVKSIYPGRTWIGGFEAGSSGKFYWWGTFEENKKITTTFWRAGEPSLGRRGAHEGCILYNYRTNSNWDDDVCTNHYTRTPDL